MANIGAPQRIITTEPLETPQEQPTEQPVPAQPDRELEPAK